MFIVLSPIVNILHSLTFHSLQFLLRYHFNALLDSCILKDVLFLLYLHACSPSFLSYFFLSFLPSSPSSLPVPCINSPPSLSPSLVSLCHPVSPLRRCYLSPLHSSSSPFSPIRSTSVHRCFTQNNLCKSCVGVGRPALT